METIKVTSGLNGNRVALWEKNPEHPDGEVYVAGDIVVEVALTDKVIRNLKQRRLILVDAPAVEELTEENAPAVEELTEGFPHRAKLIGAGFVSAEMIANASDIDLSAISGIGKAAIKAIRAAL